MRFYLACLLCCWPLAAAADDTAGCVPAETLSGNTIYFTVKKAGYYNEDSAHMEIRLPYFYDKKFRDKNVEAIIKCLDGQTLTYVDTLILLSGITDSCSGTMMEFNLTRLTLVKMNEQKFVQPRPVTKDELDWLINRANAFWRLVPKEN